MTIEKSIVNASATLNIIGRLDTSTAPELEATIDGCVAGIQELVLDCSNLEYVSSAGLRVILKAQSDVFHGVGRYGHSPSSSNQNGQGPLRSLACVASKKGHCQRLH